MNESAHGLGCVAKGALLLVAVCTGLSAQACGAQALQASVDSVQSQWQERGAAGDVLVTERGRLQQQGLAWHGDCGDWHLALEGSWVSGQRAYQGSAQGLSAAAVVPGGALQSVSRIQGHGVEAQAWHGVSGPWSVGAVWRWRHTLREVQGVGDVQGYPERYTQKAVALGVQYASDPGPWGQWHLRWGQGLGYGSHVQVALPGMDVVQLPLGAQSGWWAQWQWTGCQGEAAKPRAAGWRCVLALDYRSDRIERGSAVPVSLLGQIQATALQPATRESSATVRAGWVYEFR